MSQRPVGALRDTTLKCVAQVITGMPKARTLKGLAHDTVDHSQGAFGYLYPYLAELASGSDAGIVTVDLLGRPAISGPGASHSLEMAVSSLQDWFTLALAGYGFSISDLSAATLTCGQFSEDGSIWAGSPVIVTTSGRRFQYHRGWRAGQHP